LKLWEQLREVMRFGHFSHRTESAYWHWIKGFILFHQKRHPREMHAAAVQAAEAGAVTHGAVRCSAWLAVAVIWI
jgi:Phage integrase, N-terminal SAM-like domain